MQNFECESNSRKQSFAKKSDFVPSDISPRNKTSRKTFRLRLSFCEILGLTSKFSFLKIRCLPQCLGLTSKFSFLKIRCLPQYLGLTSKFSFLKIRRLPQYLGLTSKFSCLKIRHFASISDLKKC